MSDLMKDLILTFGGALLIERSPIIARALVKIAAKALPDPFNDIYQQAWVADLEAVEGNLSKLLAALSICANVPAIRNSHNLPAISATFIYKSLATLNLAVGAVSLLASILMNPWQATTLTPQFIQVFTPLAWIGFLSGLIVFVGSLYAINSNRKRLGIILSAAVYILLFTPPMLIGSMVEYGPSAEYLALPLLVCMWASIVSTWFGRNQQYKL